MGQEYYRRRLKANKMKRKVVAAKNFVRNIRTLIRVCLIFAIMAFGIWTLKLPQWYINSQLLASADPCVVKIEGNLITPKYKIIDIVRQTELPNTQIFRLDTSKLEKNIEQLQPVKKVYIRRYWFPARLTIAIEERTPVFLIAPNLEADAISAITAEGVFIDRDYMPISKKFKTTTILTYGVRGDDYQKWDQNRVEELLKLIKAFEAYSHQKVKYIDLRNPKDVYVQLDKVLIRLGEIDDGVLNRVKWIATILPEAQNIRQKIKYIDLRWEDAHYIKLDNGEKDKQSPNPDKSQKPHPTQENEHSEG